jgi:transcriptional regulator with XRE-family HTH domain
MVEGHVIHKIQSIIYNKPNRTGVGAEVQVDEVGQEIKRHREAKGWTGAQLAVYAGMSPSAVSQIETGRRKPNTASLTKLAEALDVEVADLFPKAQAPFPFEDDQRRFLPLIRPWFSLFDNLSEEKERISVPGKFDAGTFLASEEFGHSAMSSMNKVLRHLKAQGVDPKTGQIGNELRNSMLRYAAASRAAADAALNSLTESELQRLRKRKAEQHGGLENLPDIKKAAGA